MQDVEKMTAAQAYQTRLEELRAEIDAMRKYVDTVLTAEMSPNWGHVGTLSYAVRVAQDLRSSHLSG